MTLTQVVINDSIKETMVRILPVFLLSAVISLSGCAAISQQARPSYKVLEASSQTPPRWLEAKTSEQGEVMFFVGRADGMRDISIAENQAEAQAKAVIRAEVRERLRREFEAGPGKMAKDKRESFEVALMKEIADLDLNGVTPVERYWERIEVPVADGTTYAYRLALRVRMTKNRFEATQAQAYQSIASQIAR